MSKPRKLPKGSEKTIVFNFFNFFNFLNFLELSTCETYIFISEMQPILSKDSAKNRFSEEKENELSFLSVRFLFKSKTKHNLQR